VLRWRTLGSIGVFFGGLSAAAAQAQLSVSVAAESDHRFRGVSLSDGRPDLRLSVGLDDASGVYGGAMAVSPVRFGPDSRATELLGYVGYVARFGPAFSVEAGVASAAFVGDTRYNYSEAYVGIAGERWSARVYYAPSYFGFAQRTVYAEIDASRPLSERWRVDAHVGALSGLGAIASDAARSRHRVDARIGLGCALTASIDAQLAWVGASGAGPYVAYSDARRNTLVLSLSASF